MCNLSFLADDLSVLFFENEDILAVLIELIFHSSC